jgi:hypothetical protein
MRRLIALGLAGLALAGTAAADTPTAALCSPIQGEWESAAGGNDLAAMDREIAKIPPPCVSLKATARRQRAVAAARQRSAETRAAIVRRSVKTKVTPPLSRTWASIGKLSSLSPVDVSETPAGDNVVWKITGVYPAKAPGPSPGISFYALEIEGTNQTPVHDFDQSKTWQIQPGGRYKYDVVLPASAFSTDHPNYLGICIELPAHAGCYPSPNLREGRPN